MRRITVLAALAALAVLLTSCSRDITEGWGPPPAPSEPVPAIGQCLTTGNVAYNEKSDPAVRPVDCARPHKLEVVRIGQLADAAQVPGWGSDALRAAYADCDHVATAYAGADWHTGWIFVHLGRPSTAAWTGGTRTYVCSVAEFGRTGYSRGAAVERTGSLKGVLAAAGGPVERRCVTLHGSLPDDRGFYQEISGEERTDCGSPHDGEFVTPIELPDGVYPDYDTQQRAAGPRCTRAVADLLGLTEAALAARHDVQAYYSTVDDDTQWRAGDRVGLCYATVSRAYKVRATLKGLGAGPLPY